MPPFKTTYRISWVDTDAAQVVHFSNYFRFFEKAEEEMYQQLGFTFNEIRKKYDFWFPRVEAFCRFKAPSKYGDVLEVSLEIEEIMDKAVKYGFSMVNKASRQLVAEGYVVVVVADKKLGKAVNLPKELVEKLASYKKA
jgi:acyl-CoA thioester hydrolase